MDQLRICVHGGLRYVDVATRQNRGEERGDDGLVYLDTANLAVAAAEARLAMCLSLADCHDVVAGDGVVHCA